MKFIGQQKTAQQQQHPQCVKYCSVTRATTTVKSYLCVQTRIMLNRFEILSKHPQQEQKQHPQQQQQW